jgi:hypothetical protein
MRAFSKSLVVLAGLGFLGYGIAFLIAPEATLAGAGMQLTGTGAVVELRAFYGGLEIGLGVWLVVAGFRDRPLRPALWLTLASNGGIGGSRLLGLALGGAWNPFFGYALPWELGFAALAAGALWFSRPR